MKTNQENDQQFEVAKSLWDDYHKRTAEYASRLMVEVQELQKCFGIDSKTMENAKAESRQDNDETISRLF